MLLITFPQTWNSLIYACVSILTMRKNVKRRNHARTRSRRVFCCWVLFTFAMIMKIPCFFFSWRNYVCNWLWLLQAQGFQSQDWYGRFASLSHQPGTYWSVFVNRIRQMVSFELGKEIEKYVFVLSWAWDIEKILSAQEDSNLRRADSALWYATTEPRDYFSFVPRSWQDEKHFSRSSIVDDGAFFLWMSLYQN